MTRWQPARGLGRQLAIAIPVSVGLAAGLMAAPAPAALFADDFERGLGRWQIIGPPGAAVRESGDSRHGRVLELTPDGDIVALIRGSETWESVRLEGEMRFPSDEDNYLGVVYRHTARRGRQDFGLIYVKGNDGYLQVNPHRDFNVSRLIYPELRATLTGPAAVTTGEWQRFAVEVVGGAAHVYVGAGPAPQLTFDGFEGERGAFGLQPRSVGGAVWVDNLTARPITGFSYAGPPRPSPAYAPEALVTGWQVAGPFARSRDEIARDAAASAEWRAMPADPRGAIVTGRVVDYHGSNAVAYFRTSIDAAAPGAALLELSTVDDLAIWLNGAFQGFVARQDAAWFDVGRSPKHVGRRVPLRLRAGANDVVLRVRGGVYASGGFFARLSQGGGR